MTGFELPVEVILSIQRILEIDVASQDSDPLDSLANDFSPTDVLNELFPDEASLGRIEIIQAKLAHDECELQREIDELHVKLKGDQDPRRMLLIQEMISVRYAQRTARMDSPMPFTHRISLARCLAYARKLLNQRLWCGTSRRTYRSSTSPRKT
jgi:hypothetical protein